MNFFKNLSTAKAFGQNKWATPGKYLVKLTAVRFNNGGYKGDSFVIEGTVEAAENAGGADDPKKGDSIAHVWNASGKKQDIARNTWMGFLCAVFGCSPEDRTDDEWAKISADVIENDALKDEVMFLEVFMKKTQAGGDFTYHGWRRIATEEDYKKFGLVPSK